MRRRGPPPRMACDRHSRWDDEGAAVGADWIAEEEADAPQRLALREAMSADGPRPDTWPLFDCRLTHDAAGGGRSVVHLCECLSSSWMASLTSRCAGSSPRSTTIS